MLKVGKEYGMRAVRLPFEPGLLSWRIDRRGLVQKLAFAGFLSPWLQLMRMRLRRHGIRTNDLIFGVACSGRMTLDVVLGFLNYLPEGVTEIYFHPATRRCPEIDRTMADYHHEEEFKALVDAGFAQALLEKGAVRVAYSDL